MNEKTGFILSAVCLVALAFIPIQAIAQSPSSLLLIISKSDRALAIVDPVSLQVIARVPVGQDPHEVVASTDGKIAYISNYGGSDSTLNTISVVDLVAQKALPPIDLGALYSPHGLTFVGGKLYFTAETSKVIGRYDPATQRVEWVLGTGQDRTHMIVVSKNLDWIVTSNVNSSSVSIIEQAIPPYPGYGPINGTRRKTWEVTDLPAGKGSEGFDVSPDGKEIWVANAQDGTLTILDRPGKKVLQTISVPVKGANRLKFTPDGKQVFVSGLADNGARAAGPDLVVLDAATRKEVKRLDFGGGAAGILMVPEGSRAYVADTGTGNVEIVDLKTLEVTGEIFAGKQPDGLAWTVRN